MGGQDFSGTNTSPKIENLKNWTYWLHMTSMTLKRFWKRLKKYGKVKSLTLGNSSQTTSPRHLCGCNDQAAAYCIGTPECDPGCQGQLHRHWQDLARPRNYLLPLLTFTLSLHSLCTFSQILYTSTSSLLKALKARPKATRSSASRGARAGSASTVSATWFATSYCEMVWICDVTHQGLSESVSVYHMDGA